MDRLTIVVILVKALEAIGNFFLKADDAAAALAAESTKPKDALLWRP